jgi:hypothetical protein
LLLEGWPSSQQNKEKKIELKLVGFRHDSLSYSQLRMQYSKEGGNDVLHGSFNLPIFVYVDGVFFVREKQHV